MQALPRQHWVGPGQQRLRVQPGLDVVRHGTVRAV